MAKRVGIAIPSIYLHLSDVEHLVAAVAEHYFLALIAALVRQIEDCREAGAVPDDADAPRLTAILVFRCDPCPGTLPSRRPPRRS